MRLYIACTKSSGTYVICYRIPEMTGAISQPIEAGSQVLVCHADLNQIQIDSVIGQLRKSAGLMEQDEIARIDRVVPLVFSRDRPVKVDVIKSCIARNRGILFKKGDDTRKMAAIAADQRAVEALTQEPELRSNLHEFEMSVSEDTPGNMEREGKPINDGHRIEHGPGEAAPTPRRRSRRAA